MSVLTRTKEEKWLFLKDALWGGGGVPFWPGGRGGRPRALIPEKGVREGLARLGGYLPELAWWTGGSGRRGKGSGGGCKGFGSGGVGGRDTAPKTKFRNVCRVFEKEEKWLFLKDALWGGGGVTGAGLAEGGVDQGPGRGQGRVGRGVREAGQGLGGGCKGFGSGG